MNSTQFAYLAVATWIVVCLVAWALLRRMRQHQWLSNRLYPEAASSGTVDVPSPLRHWLLLAGFRTPNAEQLFLVSTLLLLALGVAGAWLWLRSTQYSRALNALDSFPGGVGEIFLPLVHASPWLLAGLLATTPWLVVRAVRRRRVEDIEQDLPVMLELLATLSEAGLGFDTALSRLLQSQPDHRPLVREFRVFQLEMLSGRTRVDCFRRLSRRVEVSSVGVFVSALVQAEQVGAGVASVLRQQATDVREHRREDALAQAMALPVKRLFPMMICFLPGIFVAALGPTFYQFVQYADTLLRAGDLGNMR